MTYVQQGKGFAVHTSATSVIVLGLQAGQHARRMNSVVKGPKKTKEGSGSCHQLGLALLQEKQDAAAAMQRAVEVTRQATASVAATVDELRALQARVLRKPWFVACLNPCCRSQGMRVAATRMLWHNGSWRKISTRW